jgi:hypothetical protein
VSRVVPFTPTQMAWTALRFGRHRGKTLPQVVFGDPDWFFWAYEERVLEAPHLANEARLIHRRATSIRVPMVGGQRGVAVFYMDVRGRLAGFEIVAATATLDDGARRVDRIDLSLPRRCKEYDKAGGRIVVDEVRERLFGGGRLTRRRCEEFFDNAANFVVAPGVRWKIRLRRSKK